MNRATVILALALTAWGASADRRMDIVEGDVTEWQPIKTAPLDGTHILAIFIPEMGADQTVIRYDSSGDFGSAYCWKITSDEVYRFDSFSHWMSLPEPPK